MISTPQKISNISIIIPTLNEEANIAPLAANLAGGEYDRIIVDGGSRDNTVMLAEENGFRVLEGAQGRAAQLNLGAAKARGEMLLFLHADTRLPTNFASAISEAALTKNFIAGAFSLAIDHPTPGLHFIAACANLRSRLFHLPYGDQAIFIEKERFLKLKKFPNLPIMEDYMFIKNAQKKGRIILLPDRVTTSARRWRRLGILRTTVINQLVILGFHLKISPKRLALFYRC
jgi:rSAM/selenodomain-associated transferase 2